MLRYRRYRVLIVFAVVSIFAFYHFTGLRDPERARAALERLKHLGHQEPVAPPANLPKPAPLPIPDNDQKEKTEDDVVLPIIEAPMVDHSHMPDPEAGHVEPPRVETTSSSTSSASAPTNAASVPVQPVKTDPIPGTKPQQPAFQPPKFIDPTKKPPEFKEDPNPVDAPLVKDVPWEQVPEHFAVPTESLIALPTGAKSIPRIQHLHYSETPEEKVVREQRLTAVRSAFTHSWSGYKDKAWKHDEVLPVSGGSRDTFSGWRATMVDALDTLWIMGLEKEFEEAVAEVAKIDFKLSKRHDLSLFETTIRYLGGLLGAYDVSGQNHPVLLEKAVELANVLMGAFDTPNRMPVTHYFFKPAYLSQAHRAGTRTVLAELGSLTVEFTRLSQLTKDPKYFDAVQRITDALEEWQSKTAIPGLWPKRVDASGCVKQSIDTPVSPGSGPDAKPNPTVSTANGAPNVAPQILPPEPPPPPGTDSWKQIDDGTALTKELVRGAQKESGSSYENKLIQEFGDVPKKPVGGGPGGRPMPPYGNHGAVSPKYADRLSSPAMPGAISPKYADRVSAPAVPGAALAAVAAPGPRSPNTKRQLVTPDYEYSEGADSDPSQSLRLAVAGIDYSIQDCEKQGLATPPYMQRESFTLNSQADSTYEYLPKEYMLLGGASEQYRKMYEYAMDTAKDTLLFRPMSKEGDYLISGSVDAINGELTLTPAAQHLGCFTGGMFAMGSRIFGREEDLEIGRKLTNGCVWAYESTETGIMPEEFVAVPCQDRAKCKWDEDLWYAYIYPMTDPGENAGPESSPATKQKREAAPPAVPGAVVLPPEKADTKVASQAPPQAIPDVAPAAVPNPFPQPGQPPSGASGNRQAAAQGDVVPPVPNALPQPIPEVGATYANGEWPSDRIPEPVVNEFEWNSEVPDTQAGRAQQIIKYAKLPPGFAGVVSGKYILRPEAIESVFIMYRITGDQSWREKGWKMFQAIDQHTKTEYGHSAIEDVMHTPVTLKDEMESFWLAETLKYFYLLFADESVVSLDDFVLNTEAHPLRRPKEAVQ